MPIEVIVDGKQANPLATSHSSEKLIQISFDNPTENELNVSEPMLPQGKPTTCFESHQNVQAKTCPRSIRRLTLAKSSVWRRGWKTLVPIIGFYILGALA
jgi:hypothetical protein